MEQISSTDFPNQYEFGEHKIEYIEISEVGKGGPKIGRLLIDDKDALPNQFFSGPPVFFGNLLLVPLVCRSLFNTKFKIVSVHLDTCQLTPLGPETGLILLEKIENGKLYFFTDLTNAKRRNIRINV